jgi:WD40 repeat protein
MRESVKIKTRIACLVVAAMLVSLGVLGCSGPTSRVGSMLAAREMQTATLLQDGRVLIAGGRSGYQSPSLASAEIFDPKTGVFSATGSMSTARSFHTATLLADGRVLIAGGQDASDPPTDLASAELYDPKTGTFSPTGSMSKPRASQTATLLKDGRVLIVDDLGASADLYDPKTGEFTPTGSMSQWRTMYTATLLPDGRVLIAGGADKAFIPLASAELYDLSTGTFHPTGSMKGSRDSHTATLLADGRVLIAGGEASPSDILATGELYDPTTGTFTLTQRMEKVRENHTATILPDGRVLIAGGLGMRADPDQKVNASAELYDTTTQSFVSTGSMSVARAFQVATLLSDGRVLMSGGSNNTGTLASAEVYDPKTGTFSPAGQ